MSVLAPGGGLYWIQMFAILTGLDRVIIKRPNRSQSHRMRPGAARHLSGVGTSRSALLLTVRVESGIARTKSNNGPRSWLCSLFLFCAPDTLLLQDTKLHHVRAHTHTHTHTHLPASVWPPTVALVGEGGVSAAGGGGGGGRL